MCVCEFACLSVSLSASVCMGLLECLRVFWFIFKYIHASISSVMFDCFFAKHICLSIQVHKCVLCVSVCVCVYTYVFVYICVFTCVWVRHSCWFSIIMFTGQVTESSSELVFNFHLLLCCLNYILQMTPRFQLKPPFGKQTYLISLQINIYT